MAPSNLAILSLSLDYSASRLDHDAAGGTTHPEPSPANPAPKQLEQENPRPKISSPRIVACVTAARPLNRFPLRSALESAVVCACKAPQRVANRLEAPRRRSTTRSAKRG